MSTISRSRQQVAIAEGEKEIGQCILPAGDIDNATQMANGLIGILEVGGDLSGMIG